MKSVEELDVFKLSHRMTLQIHELTKGFPKQEKFGLIPQMRKASYSVPMNLAEGANRFKTKEYKQFVGIAKGSAAEVKYQLMLAKDLSYIDEADYRKTFSEYERICQMLGGLARSLT